MCPMNWIARLKSHDAMPATPGEFKPGLCWREFVWGTRLHIRQNDDRPAHQRIPLRIHSSYTWMGLVLSAIDLAGFVALIVWITLFDLKDAPEHALRIVESHLCALRGGIV